MYNAYQYKTGSSGAGDEAGDDLTLAKRAFDASLAVVQSSKEVASRLGAPLTTADASVPPSYVN